MNTKQGAIMYYDEPEGAKMPETEENEAPNLVDVNGAPSAMDEDGELDESPTVHSFAMRTTHPAHSLTPLTEIIATLHAPTGYIQKRKVVPGHITVNKLSALLLDVAEW